MAKYFKNVKSYEDLKKQFKNLLKANHPDNGGDAETMKEINCEYDALFPIWKNRHNAENPLYALSSYTAPDHTKILLKQDYNILVVFFPDEY